jgi:hypothetical protein
VIRVVGADTVAVPRARVALHMVRTDRSGPVDSVVADARGRFAFVVTPDSGAIYLVSARYAGIDYFAAPLSLAATGADTGLAVLVSDTSSAAPIRLAARHLIISPVDGDGLRSIVDLIVVDNPGPLTRVSADSATPTWSLRLSPFAVNIHGGNSDFSLSSMTVDRGTIALFAAVPPGQRDIEIDYQIPPGSRRFELPVDQDAPVSNIVTEDRTLRVTPGFSRSDTVIGGKSYARWRGRMVAGVPLLLTFGASEGPSWLLPALVAAMAVALAAVTGWASRRRH